MTPAGRADLKFGPGPSAGFSAAGIAAFDDLRPAAVVRELVQNSLDAARSALVPKAIVRFRLTSVARDDIPGITAFEAAFRNALERQRDAKTGALPGQARLIADRIEAALAAPRLDVLSVVDNGVGLDDRRMNALLSDGVSAKENRATGTYGNGHFTAVPASDLRYVLYGGVTADGARIASGHAVLASHYVSGEDYLRGADGLFINGFNAGQNTLYDYVTGPDIPELIHRDLNHIHSTHGHGTSVIVTAFNHFLEKDDSLWSMVTQAASANFFVAIEDGALEITVDDRRPGRDSSPRTLDRSSLPEVLAEHQDQKRSGAFLSGYRAFNAYRAFRNGQRHAVKTEAGKIEVHLLETPDTTTRIDLCRNGMWITDDKSPAGITGFYYRFSERIPFQAVLSLNADDGGDLHELIRIAEGPLHDSIRVKRLPRADQTRCRKALNEIRTWILDHTKPIQSDSYTPDDFLTLDFGDEAGGGAGKSVKAHWGTPVSADPRSFHQLRLFPDNSTQETEPGKFDPGNPGQRRSPNADRFRRRPSLPPLFQAASRPVGKHRRRIVIDCLRDYADAELRLIPDEAIDATCDRPNQDPYMPTTLANVTVNGRPVAEQNLRTWEKRVVGIRLGDLTEGASIEIETDYHLSGDFAGLPDPALRIQLFRSASEPEDKSDDLGSAAETVS